MATDNDAFEAMVQEEIAKLRGGSSGGPYRAPEPAPYNAPRAPPAGGQPPPAAYPSYAAAPAPAPAPLQPHRATSPLRPSAARYQYYMRGSGMAEQLSGSAPPLPTPTPTEPPTVPPAAGRGHRSSGFSP